MRKSIKELFVDELHDILSAEEQIVKALPKMIIAAESVELKNAFKTHLKETVGQVKRLVRIFKLIHLHPKTKFCKGTKGLIQECQEVIKEFVKSPLRDAALISKAQRIEHYEISAYGTLRTFAKELGLNEIAGLLQETLVEEASADKKLTKIAEGGLFRSGVNQKALITGDSKIKAPVKRTLKKKPAKKISVRRKTKVSHIKVGAKKIKRTKTTTRAVAHKAKAHKKVTKAKSINGKRTVHAISHHPRTLSPRAKAALLRHHTASKKFAFHPVSKRAHIYAGRH